MDAYMFLPELVLLAGGLAAFGMSLTDARAGALRAVALGFGLAYALAALGTLSVSGSLFYDAYRVDLFSQMVKCALGAGFVLMLLFGAELKGIPGEVRGEYYFFLLTALLGLTLLVSSVELITLFLALELSSYSLYLLVPMRQPAPNLRAPMEAAIKYLLFGMAASGIMLFGMSWVFGLAGTTYLPKIMTILHGQGDHPVMLMALTMLLCGMFFKLAVFPFHFWAPDVYQGASNDTTAFIAALPKIAAIAVLARFCGLCSPDSLRLPMLLTALSVVSMFYGNLTALVQTDVKRMLGYSGIAHAGYILLGMVTLQSWGFATALYYGIGYLFMMLTAFLVLCTVAPGGDNVSVSDLNGLSRRSPLLALIMAVSMFGLAGIPPFVGFMGKFMLLTSAYRAGHVLLVVFAAVNTAVGIYYYLQVVRAAYAEPAPSAVPVALTAFDHGEALPAPDGTALSAADGTALATPWGTRLAGVCLMALVLALGLVPETVVRMAATAMQAAW